MKRTARDVMQTRVITVAPHDPLHTVQRLFYEEGIHGAPVVDEMGRVQGVITSTDILRAAADAHDVPDRPTVGSVDEGELPGVVWGMSPEDFRERLEEAVVADHMTEQVIQVAPDTPVAEVARVLRENQVHRALVVDKTRLCGVVSAFDLIALLEGP
jgi:CBS domain-containing protein